MTTPPPAPSRRWIYPLAMVFVCMFAAVTVSIIYADRVGAASQRAAEHAIEKSQQEMCAVLVPINAIYHQPPPNDPKTYIGKQLAERFDQLIQQYHCPRS